MMYKEYLSAIGICLTFLAYIPYIRSILKDEIKPHVFSWGIWGVTTLIVFLTHLSDNEGVGAWVIGVSGVLVTFIAFLAYFKKADASITKLDWVFLSIAVIALCAWYFSSSALSAVIILTLMNVIGFAPTIRKSYDQPYSEGLSFFMVLVPRNLISIAALEHYSMITIFFPAITAMACLTLIGVVVFRRRTLKIGHVRKT